jgi:hypothetical protein
MRTFVLDIIVIELFSAGGFPLEEASEHCLSNQSALSGVILYHFGIIVVLFWLYCCSSAISSYLFMFCILFISGILIDLGGYWWPPTYSNWLLLTFFSSTCSFVLLCNCGFYTFRDFLNPYTSSKWILVASHLIQLDYFVCFHVSTSCCTSKAVLGP